MNVNTGGGGKGGRGFGGGGGKWGWYAGQVQARINDALRSNKRTRTASIPALQVRIWPDGSGRVTRAQLVGSTGDAGIDSALQNEVLGRLQLTEPPPQGMPTPIILKLAARRPN
jgi:hypothetical protein